MNPFNRLPNFESLRAFFSFKSLNERMKKLQFRFHLLKKQLWPIRWDMLMKPDILVKSAQDTLPVLKGIIIIASIGVFASFSLILWGIYIESTRPVFAEGGEVREAVLGSEMSVFNPVVRTSSEAEQRINRLLYHPLYEVVYPDFINSSEAPKIKPILLESEPKWMNDAAAKPSENFKVLRFKLRQGIKWSDDSPISMKDIEYTYNLLKPSKDEPGGNLQFRDILSQTTLNIINDYEFEIISKESNPQLIYSIPFSPISRSNYSNLNIEGVERAQRSSKPMVTSGYFTFAEGKVMDPDNSKGEPVDNPIKDEDGNTNKSIVLTKNPHQNTTEPIYVNKYIFKKYTTVEDKGGNGQNSIERAMKDGKVDLFGRYVSPNSSISTAKLKNISNLSYSNLQTNTFYNLYLNIKVNDYFINQSLRKYVLCSFLKLNVSSKYNQSVLDIPKDKRLLPLHFKVALIPDCPEDTESVLDSKFYAVTNSDGKKQVVVLGSPAEITLAGSKDTEPLLNDVKSYFEQIGIGVTEVISGPTEIQDALKSKKYSALFLPVTQVSNDPYSLYSANAQNLSNIQQNNKVLSYDFENTLKTYSASQLQDQDAKKKLMDFFQNEYVSMNLFQATYEVYNSDRVNTNILNGNTNIFKSKLSSTLTYPSDYNLPFNELAFSTKRVGK